MMDFEKKANAIEEELKENRRTVHAFAETGFELPKTVDFVCKKLREYGYQPKLVGKSGVSCTVGKGGKTVLLRADMDALPMAEETGLPFAAENGNCHSCGHDCHTAMLLGAARLLKEEEASLKGTVKFMFQPAEELLAGATDMIEAGILEDPHVDAAMAMHLMVGTDYSKAGHIFYTPGTAMFSGDAIRITVKGKEAHGSTPENGVDAITIASHIVINLQEIIAREVPCTEEAVLIVGKIEGGHTCNTLAGTAVMEASIRAVTEERRQMLKDRLKAVAEDTARLFRGEATVDFVYGMGPLVNQPELTQEFAGYCMELLPKENCHEMPVVAGSEDFTSVAAKVPSIYISLGAGSQGEGHSCGMHNPSMVPEESVLPEGAALYCHCAARYLEEQAK